MTIIRPNDNQKKLFNIIIFSLGFCALSFIIIGIVLYGSVVGLQHDIQRTQQEIQKEQLASTKIQNQMYGIIDVAHLEQKVIEMGLVKEKSPEYINKRPKIEAEVSVSTARSL